MKKFIYIIIATVLFYLIWSYLDYQYVKTNDDKEDHINFLGDIKKIDFDLPVIVINTNGRQIVDGPKLTAKMQLIDNPNGDSRITDKPIFESLIAIEIRGNSTQRFPKKQYSFYTMNNIGEKEYVKLYDFPEDCDWILNGPYGDKTLIRNSLAYELAEQAGIPSNKTKFVEVFVDNNGNGLEGSDYQGIYILTQRVKRAKHRIDIKSLNRYCTREPYITGGYIIAIDRDRIDQSSFKTKKKTKVLVNYPNNDNLTWKQYNWIKDYMNEFETALSGPDFKDPQKGYRKYIDEDTFIDYMLISEFLKNIDAFRLSTFIYKDRGEKLKIGPIWDYNFSMGNCKAHRAYRTSDWLIYNKYWHGYQHPFWWKRFVEDEEFNNRLRARWFELRKTVFNMDNINSLIDKKVAYIKNGRIRNFKKWHSVIGKKLYLLKAPYHLSYDEEINRMKKFLAERVVWIDNNIEYIHDKERNKLVE